MKELIFPTDPTYQPLGPGACDRWLCSRFPNPLQDPDLLAVFSTSDAFSARETKAETALDNFGCYLWLVLSYNNLVITSDQNEVSLGSFRDSSATLADWLNRSVDARWFSHGAFYLSGIGFSRESTPERSADITRYRFIFQRLLVHGDRWIHRESINNADLLPSDDHASPDDQGDPAILAYYAVYGRWPR